MSVPPRRAPKDTGPSASGPPAGSMRELARVVAESKSLASRLAEVAHLLPAQGDAPFLYRQLERTLVGLRRAIGEHLPEISAKMSADAERDDTNLLDRVRKTLKKRRGRNRDDIAADLEDSLEEGLQGNTWTVPIPDLLGFLATGRKTGVLWVHNAQETFLLQLEAGDLIHATSDGNPDRMRLGEVLVHLGCLTIQDLDAFVAGLGEGAGFLGAELVQAGRIGEADLKNALAFQIQEMFRRLVASRSSVFRFQEGMRLMARADVQLNIQSVLLEVMRQADELNKALSMFDQGGDELGFGADGDRGFDGGETIAVEVGSLEDDEEELDDSELDQFAGNWDEPRKDASEGSAA